MILAMLALLSPLLIAAQPQAGAQGDCFILGITPSSIDLDSIYQANSPNSTFATNPETQKIYGIIGSGQSPNQGANLLYQKPGLVVIEGNVSYPGLGPNAKVSVWCDLSGSDPQPKQSYLQGTVLVHTQSEMDWTANCHYQFSCNDTERTIGVEIFADDGAVLPCKILPGFWAASDVVPVSAVRDPGAQQLYNLTCAQPENPTPTATPTPAPNQTATITPAPTQQNPTVQPTATPAPSGNCGGQDQYPCATGCKQGFAKDSITGACTVTTENPTTAPSSTTCGGQNQYPCANGCNKGFAKDVITGACNALAATPTPAPSTNCGGQDQYPCANGCKQGFEKDAITGACTTTTPINTSNANAGKFACGGQDQYPCQNMKCKSNLTIDPFTGACGQLATGASPANVGGSPPALPGQSAVASLSVGIHQGWNLIAPPFKNPSSWYSQCPALDAYTYNWASQAYEQSSLNTPQTLAGQGVWAYSPVECAIKYYGDYEPAQKLSLKQGWNFVSVQTRAFLDSNALKSNCIIKSGPYAYGTTQGQWAQTRQLQPGIGYAIQVDGDCTITATGANAPSAPPAIPPIPVPQ